MATNLATLLTRTRRWIHELVESESFFSNNLMTNLLNASYKRRVSQIIMAYEGDFTQTALRDLTADQASYAWPADLARLRRLDQRTPDGTRIPIPRFERHTEITNPTSVEPITFRPTGSGFILEPTPSVTITNGLYVEYQVTPNDLEANGDTLHTDWPEMYTELLILDTVAYLMDSESNLEDGAARSILRARAEMDQDFDRWINSKIIKRQNVQPLVGHYIDS